MIFLFIGSLNDDEKSFPIFHQQSFWEAIRQSVGKYRLFLFYLTSNFKPERNTGCVLPALADALWKIDRARRLAALDGKFRKYQLLNLRTDICRRTRQGVISSYFSIGSMTLRTNCTDARYSILNDVNQPPATFLTQAVALTNRQ